MVDERPVPFTDDRLKLVYCQKCRNPVGKVAPGSRVEFKCHRCGIRTYVELKAA